MYINVLTEISNKNVDKYFTYHVPNDLVSRIKKGIRVKIPFGKQTLEAFVIDINVKTDLDNVKDILDIVDDEVILSDELLDLGKEMQKMYLSSLVSCYQVMLPKALKAKVNANINKKIVSYIKLINKNYEATVKQKELIDMLKSSDMLLSDANKISKSIVKTLLNRKVIRIYEKEEYRSLRSGDIIKKNKLTKEQTVALESIKNSKKDIVLLHGVTGSGKTLIYMELIEEILKNNLSAIMLVPEISLTEQITSRFIERFGTSIAVLHSRLSEGEKYDEYRRIKNGEVKIVIGARSAIFAPLSNIGLIIIDECHTSSFKQDNDPKYDALDIAKLRMKYHNLKVVLGSATPNIDTYIRAVKGIYDLVTLEKRVNNIKMPKVEIIDMNNEVKKRNSYFSDRLKEEMKKSLDNNFQVMLLLNRRGYSSFISCKNCGYVSKCPNCDITLTYHKTSNTLRCHYCGYGTNILKICPECKEESLSNMGYGTEKIEEELYKLFPNNKVIRMDVDTTTKKGSHERIIKDFKDHKADILLGTQIIAKGLDFPLVNLVGVINADTSLNIPSFRSGEETYQLLSQVAGRSGRSNVEGKVIIQTFNKDHYVFKYVEKHDYVGFFKEEMSIRKKLNYPPYYFLVGVKILSSNYNLARDTANEIGSILRKYLKESIILGPTIASVFRINNIYRFQIVIKYKKEENLYKILDRISKHYLNNNLKIDIDFNPNHI